MESPLYLPHGEVASAKLDRNHLLSEALETIVRDYPPQDSYGQPLKGLWNGPTSIAYLFLHVAAARPELLVASRPARHWAQAYLGGTRDPEAMVLEPSARCGISSEVLAWQAVRASLSGDPAHVAAFLSHVPAVVDGPAEAEWHSGRAGMLYLLRMICHWVPESAPLLQEATALVRGKIVAEGPDWEFKGQRYIGAVHGDIGTLTQVALSGPTVDEKKKLQQWLARLLDWQKQDGNWPVNEQVDPRPYVQFCHGAPGFVQSLKSIRPLFPELDDEISRAITLGNELVWREGLLKKEPNLCHGAFGNCLTLPPTQRDVFLELATPRSVAEARLQDEAHFEKANYGWEFSLLTGYWPGAAWAWLVGEEPEARFIGYNDV
ncbi:hypothetical protein PFICI_14159 [Pestalotiopsis fici W106-1]|uniref:Squalene cyclase C-terminal domain-containing protein n=1 Tax=Pestalotiopsis fici (strain W106-1 / CGMCC3.15140) TaxID=1229662 RepID=W3WKB2_PESFW|nr:uncharacterized protein PFICI_14159 [Pestalotiopsis fici W106-1]ETS74293.1 hypothetical protein PFICI_14159 [Pestalotiopsis fici W106-1]